MYLPENDWNKADPRKEKNTKCYYAKCAFAFSIESKYFNSDGNMLSMANKSLLSFQ